MKRREGKIYQDGVRVLRWRWKVEVHQRLSFSKIHANKRKKGENKDRLRWCTCMKYGEGRIRLKSHLWFSAACCYIRMISLPDTEIIAALRVFYQYNVLWFFVFLHLANFRQLLCRLLK